jgi:hypothetical protein
MACFSHPQPEIARNPAVVPVHLAVAFPPVVELAGRDVEPPDEPSGTDPNDKSVRPDFRLKGSRAVLEELLLPAVEDRGLSPCLC